MEGDPKSNEERIFLLNINDIQNRTAKGLTVDGKDYIVIKFDDKIYVYEDRCPHQDMQISENYEIEGRKIVCMWHGAEFDIETGTNLSMPAPAPLKKIHTMVDESGNVFVVRK